MNERSDVSRVLGHWFDEGPSTMPDRVVGVVADRIARERQRPARRLPWRPLVMNPSWKFEVVVASLILAVAVGWVMLPRGGTSPGVVPAASPEPTARATPPPTAQPAHVPERPGERCENDNPGCAGILEAGGNASVNFKPALTYEVPDGWVNTADNRNDYAMRPYAAGGSEIRMWSNALIPTEVGCNLAASSRPSRASDWVDFIRQSHALIAVDQAPVTMGDGSGWMLDLEVSPDWRESCPGLPGPYLVQFITSRYGDVYGVSSPDRMRLYIVDVGDQTVLAWSYGRVLADLYEDTFRSNQPVFDSLRFSAQP